jgi:subtilase family serine protease
MEPSGLPAHSSTSGRRPAWPAALGAALLLATAAAGATVQARTIANNTPAATREAQDLGPANASETISVTLWLQAPDSEAAAEQLVRELYDPNSPRFHRWLSEPEANALLAPSAAQAELIRKYLTDHRLRVVAVDEGRLYVRAQGTIADVQSAFHVSIHNYTSGGRSFRSNVADPAVDEPAGSVVAAVSGLSEHHMRPLHVRPIDPDTGAPPAPTPLAAVPTGAFFSAQCFRAPEEHTFTTHGGLPTAHYVGNRYGADITNTTAGTLPPCGYRPSELQSAYGLSPLYAAGLDGTGQTVVIVDAIGSPTITSDAEAFSQVYGLPDLTAENFKVYFPGGPPPASSRGWAAETSLDVEWAHSVAPGANIALVIAPTANDSDLQAAILFAIRHHLGNVISNSWGEAESDEPAATLNYFNRINRLAASRGISVNFSSGDSGDSNPSGITPGLILPGVSTPADSPWGTAVGGTSLALDSDNHITLQTAWGTNLTRIVNTEALGSPPIVPPLELGFQFGSGGGSSGFFAKPDFQRALPGNQRLVPDIAFLADPYTGVEIVCDGTSCFGLPPGSGPQVAVIGGTSLACPMFSALWAIANQGAGDAGLGQAARLLYSLPGGAITDVVAVGSENNVRGSITTTSGTTHESASALAQPLGTSSPFYSALYNGTSTRWYVITFGTDSSLAATPGWDEATGLGTPNGMAFVNAVLAGAAGGFAAD